MDVGSRIVELRMSKNLSTNKLANLSGVSQSYLRDVELGKKNPTVEFLSYICYGLGVSLEGFFSKNSADIDPILRDALRELSREQQLKLAEFINTITSK